MGWASGGPPGMRTQGERRPGFDSSTGHNIPFLPFWKTRSRALHYWREVDKASVCSSMLSIISNELAGVVSRVNGLLRRGHHDDLLTGSYILTI